MSRRQLWTLALFSLLAAVTYSISNGANIPPQLKSVCAKQACTKQATISKDPDCPNYWVDPVGPVREDCKFDQALTDLIWCNTDPNQQCTVVAQQTTNKCTGYCHISTGTPCYSAEKYMCTNPTPIP